jgi:hypothetical protein
MARARGATRDENEGGALLQRVRTWDEPRPPRYRDGVDSPYLPV